MKNQREKRESLYRQYREELLAAQRLNSEGLDKSILSLSTAFLGLSVVFIRDVIPVESSEGLALLKLSWALFCAAIILTLVSFLTSQFGIIKQLDYAEKAFIENDKAFINKTTWLAGITVYLNLLFSIIFILALVSTTAYMWINFQNGG